MVAKTKNNYPPTGTTLFVVREHFYYKQGRSSPLLEYIVCPGKVKGFIEGKYTEIKLVLENAGANNLAFPKPEDIGKTVFYTEYEAALLAKAMTEDYEKRWTWTAEYGDIPLRRPWEKCLEGAKS